MVQNNPEQDGWYARRIVQNSPEQDGWYMQDGWSKIVQNKMDGPK